MNSYLSMFPSIYRHTKRINAGHHQRCHICCFGDGHILNAGRLSQFEKTKSSWSQEFSHCHRKRIEEMQLIRSRVDIKRWAVDGFRQGINKRQGMQTRSP